ncbi:MAG: S-formylglutathione hydrolase [Kordiimonadaceae bacterium]|nr:S-formylglutathione hydrolase [Kordiimonadaceae bacterium]MBO6568648.1 S-formylglutathione hydrolase [Kordiimonadaceae bacterium]MBO6965376.1 S-formylglutathione hydrolase [Kordiimonadaceae bacterium]
MALEIVSESQCFGGKQLVFQHSSDVLGCDMKTSVFVPRHGEESKMPVVWFLSGLTSTHENAPTKSGFQRVAAELGLIVVCPDTSPRGDHVPDDEAWDFGQGAGFYLDATEEPWSRNFNMESYVARELPCLVGDHFPADMARQAIIGHSMGGHGALTIALKNPDRFKSVSAFSPIVSPMNCPWGEKALAGYLGDARSDWAAHDACALVASAASQFDDILIDQGTADNFLEGQLKPELFQEACAAAGQKLSLRMQEGYDHSYNFIATFIEDHLRFHAARL